MTYKFSGFLTSNSAVAAAARQQWPLCRVKHVTEQADCYIVLCPTARNLSALSQEESESCNSIEDTLARFSDGFPSELLIFLRVLCWAGDCEHWGFHIQNGKKVKVFEEDDGEVTSLKEILAPLDIAWTAADYFEPLTRGYFEGEEGKCKPEQVRASERTGRSLPNRLKRLFRLSH